MRWFLLLALVGCTTEFEELDNLEQHAKSCGGVPGFCAETTDVTGVVTCMNDALASGTLSLATWSNDVTYNDYYIFTETDHFLVYLEDYASSGDSEIRAKKTCTGPLKTTTTAACGEYLQLELDGC